MITGTYTDRNGAYRGFIRDSAGVFTSIDVTGAGTERGQGTLPWSINNRGEVTGNYASSSGVHGFLRDAAGNVTTFDVPEGSGAWPQALNNNGDIVGYYFGSDGSLRGFSRYTCGKFTNFEPPGSTIINPTAINDSDYVCGENFDSAPIASGFLRLPSGIFLLASGPQPNAGGYCQDVNNYLRAIGSYTESKNVTHGWIR